MVKVFKQDLEELLVVPKLCDHKKDNATLRKNEVLAAFISFLLQLLYHKTALIVAFEDQVDRLQNELRFLVMVLGDTSILLEQVHENLLAEFEAVANEAETAVVDSLFIVDPLLLDLEDLMNRVDDRIVELMDKIKRLYQGLMRSQSFLNVIKGPRHSEIEELNVLVMRIRDVAYEAEYLIYSVLVEDALCFPDDGNGSRIIFTSRHRDVAPLGSVIHALPFLSNDQSWELLTKKVFQNKPCPLQLLQIGKEIVASCCGLPLAVVVIACILSTVDKDESTWKTLGGNLASYILDGGDNSVMKILELSYKHLPEHLKPCFLYFGAFLENKEIPARILMRLWIAKGFIRKEEKKSSESIAEEYLMELIDKSLVIVAKRRWDGGVKACVVHDLLRELCVKIATDKNFLKLAMNKPYILEMLIIPLEIMMMAKLKYLQVIPRAKYDTDCSTSRTNNIEFLSNYLISDANDEEMLKCTPHLRKLKCECEPLWFKKQAGEYRYRYPDLRFLTQLESLNMTSYIWHEMAEINFPSNIKKLTLHGLHLPWEKMSIIGRLPNLEILKLGYLAFDGETWDTNDGEFQ
ncbi:hypothetical protein DH2020_016038 [Rehmannia glutinosa]|uniref:Uncharacterized protein n=1 Tax=Rehmannia glutinosa TaxID=99300 RepID=A0ABR0WVW1_REHGL